MEQKSFQVIKNFAIANFYFIDKTYLMNVVNTLDPGLILKTILALQKEREQKKIEDDPIHIR